MLCISVFLIIFISPLHLTVQASTFQSFARSLLL